MTIAQRFIAGFAGPQIRWPVPQGRLEYEPAIQTSLWDDTRSQGIPGLKSSCPLDDRNGAGKCPF
jgi:hypothetical protein